MVLHAEDTTVSTAGYLSEEEVARIDAWWRAANYLSVGQIYLLDNPLLKRPLTLDDIKPRLLGHWGTTPGLNFIYAHLNRVIRQRGLDMIFVCGPGHGGPGVVANVWLEGTYSQYYPDVSLDEEGMKRLFKQFSFPGGIPSHVAPETPGSIHEGGELGYSLSHAHGAAFDNKDLVVACVVGDGEAETGPLAASWQSNKFLDPVRDGCVLPILHLNGYKIASPAVLARIPRDELTDYLTGVGYDPHYVEGHDPAQMHQAMAAALDRVFDDIGKIERDERSTGQAKRPRWPMIVLVSPKGWTGPKEVDGMKTEGFWRSHQVPLSELAEEPEHVKMLESWMRSYRPEELFDENGAPRPELRELAPKGKRRMGDNPHANGGLLRRPLKMPDYMDFGVEVKEPGKTFAEATKTLGKWLASVMDDNCDRFRIFGPDETASNRLSDIYAAAKKVWVAQYKPEDAQGGELAPDGRVMELLSETTTMGWMEGYVLTGRHGLWNSYEAFAHIIDSMFNQDAKWLTTSQEISWRAPVSSMNILLSSHVWRQDHNGFSHQDPGFIDNVINKKGSVIRVYLPPDANCLLSIADHCLRSRNHFNVIVAGKQPALQYLDIDTAKKHCSAGIGIWEWASNDAGAEPDVVVACAGDIPTLEALAAVDLLRQHTDVKVRFVNVVDLMTLTPPSEHPHGLSDRDFDDLFTRDRPIVFAYHGYPWLIHRLTYRRTNHGNLHVRGFKEEGTTTTPFDMVVRNQLDRFDLFADVVYRVPKLQHLSAYVRQFVHDKLVDHRDYIEEYGKDLPEITSWTWPY